MATFNDPGFPQQWQLGSGRGINTTPLYDQYRGAGVSIGQIDTGVDYRDPDFAGRYDFNRDYDALQGDSDALNVGGDQHGTDVARLLVATANNGYGIVGAAPEATLVAYRLATRDQRTEAQELNLLQRQTAVDVSHNSWSRSGELFRDDFGTATYAQHAAAIANTAASGRGGRGTVIVRSAGNEAAAGDDVNTHNYQNNRFTTTVGATDINGLVQSFSNPGAAVTVVAPGEATSYAAPLVSGTAALMLQANPTLGWRDVQTILAATARLTDEGGAGWFANAATNWNGGGMHASRDAGFGLVDARAAVRVAESWRAVSVTGNEQGAAVSGAAFGVPDTGTVESRVSIGRSLRTEWAELRLDLTHARPGDLVVSLVSPGGAESVLLNRVGNGGYTGDGTFNFTLTSHQFLGEEAAGTWTLRVRDQASGNAGTVTGWSLSLFGADPGTERVQLFTDEYFALSASAPSRAVLSGTGGVDTLNAAAVTSPLVLDLRPGATTWIAGRAATVAGGALIENAEGGDGRDVLRGNAAGNLLRGWRGDDLFVASGGADRVVGGEGYDVLRFETLARGNGRLSLPGGIDAENAFVWGSGNGTTFQSVERVELAGGGRVDFVSNTAAAAVDRLYLTVLGRDADRLGLSTWNDLVEEGGSLGTVAISLLDSAEARATSGYVYLGANDFIQATYRVLLGRDATGAEVSANGAAANGGSAGRANLLAGVAVSAEAQAVDAGGGRRGLVVEDREALDVARAYRVVLQRDADLGGLRGFEAQVEANAADRAGVGRALAGSGEFAARFGGVDDTAYLTSLYRTGFGRDPSQGEINGWVNAFQSGAASRGSAAVAVLEAQEGNAQFAQLADTGFALFG